MGDIYNSLIQSALGSSKTTTTEITPTNPVNATVWTSGKDAVPNPFFAAMNQQTVQNIQMAANGNIGGILASRGKISGSTATIINATLDYFLAGQTSTTNTVPTSLANYAYTKNFIPIILKTEFNYMGGKGKGNDKTKTPLYIIFDSTPENISFGKTANWQGRGILGRPEPIQTYSDSGPTTVSLTGDFFVDSESEHLAKLKLSDYIMALATPSRDNYMPSPVQVIIGEWKNFRAIVNSVNVDFKGPWTVSAAKTQASLQEAANANVSSIPSHAPYFFTATLNLTLVSKENSVNYAEDVINNAGMLQEISATDIANIKSTMVESSSSTTLTSGAFTLGQTSSGYVYKDGMLVATSTYQTGVNSKFKAGNGDQERMTSDLTVITRAVSDKLSAIIKAKI